MGGALYFLSGGFCLGVWVKLKFSSLLKTRKIRAHLSRRRTKERERESKRTTKSKLSSFVPIVNDEVIGERKREGRKKMADTNPLMTTTTLTTSTLQLARRRTAIKPRCARRKANKTEKICGRRRRETIRAHADTSNDGKAEEEDDNNNINERLQKLEKVFLIVFNLGEANEALYTTSSRQIDIPRNDFLCFQSMQDAIRASVLISEQTDLMPVVESVSAEVVLFLCSRSGYGVELVGKGEKWTPPGVVIEDEEALVEDANSGEKKEEELAISSADLEKYLADGGSFREEIREQFYSDNDASTIEEQNEQEKEEAKIANTDLNDARRIAAYAVQSAASKPIKALTTAFERTAKLSTLKSLLRRNANNVSKTTNTALMSALKNVALARKRKKSSDDE